MACSHPKGKRVKVRGERVRCGKCGHEFRPRGARVEHGTYNGYCRHLREKAGSWGWPIMPADQGGCGCKEAATAWRREYHQRPEKTADSRRRGAARMEALARLRRAFPAMYAQFYAEEHQRLGGDGKVFARQQDWDELVRRLVKAACNADEAELLERMRGGWASGRDREVIRMTSRIRVLLSETTHQRRPDNGKGG